MRREQVVKAFEAHGITLHPAGIWKMSAKGKEPVVPHRADGLPLDSYLDDNMMKLRIEQSPYMVIDLDAPPGDVVIEIYNRLPSVHKTLTTTTTASNKQHIYIVRPDEFPLTRVVGALKNVDLLANGIVFEGHMVPSEKVVGASEDVAYDIENGDTIVKLTPKEIDWLMSLVPKSQASRKAEGPQNRRFNVAERALVEEYISGKMVDTRPLWKTLTPRDQRKQGRTDYKAPKLSYDTFNTMAFYLALNEYIPHEMVVRFIETVLVQEYKISLTSQETQQRLYKQIIPTLPVCEGEDMFNDDFDTHLARAPISKDGRFLLVSTVDNSGAQKFVMLDKHTLLPQTLNGTVLRAQKAVQAQYPTLDADTFTYGVPQIELTSDPYKPHKLYDFDRNVFTLNTLKPTEYMLEYGSLEEKPVNVLTRAIHAMMKRTEDSSASVDPEDFYYHWLSHVIFSQKQMSTILSLSTDSTVQGGTGKSTFTAKLPMHILPRGTVFSVDESTAGWGDAFHNSKLTCFDDLHDTKSWDKLYTTMNRETSGTISKRNIKGQSTQIAETSASLAVSSNFLPKIDETDRRFFIWAPTEKLSEEEGREIAKIMSDFDVYRQEIQDIVSYCNYLYRSHGDKYYRELYIEAPRSSYNAQAKTEGATGKKLLSIILNGPNTLFDSFVPNKKRAITNREIVETILEQITEPTTRSKGKHTLHLPQDLGKLLLNATRDEDMLNESPRNIALALGCTFVSMSHIPYKEHAKMSDWATRGVRLAIDEETIAKYKNWLKYNGKDIAEVGEVDV